MPKTRTTLVLATVATLACSPADPPAPSRTGGLEVTHDREISRSKKALAENNQAQCQSPQPNCCDVYPTSLLCTTPNPGCVPSGTAMQGVHFADNIMMFASLINGVDPSTVYVDGEGGAPTQRNGMHCCAFGWFMVGFNGDKNWLVCAKGISTTGSGTAQVTQEFVDSNGATQGTCANGFSGVAMHRCGDFDSVMTGINVSSNSFTCGRVCEHSLCASGGPLAANCDDCVSNICERDVFCCDTEWDSICISEVATFCSRSC
jgi:hypothetical protein